MGGNLELYKADPAIPSKRIWVVAPDGTQSLEPMQGVQELGIFPADFNLATYYTLTTEFADGPFTPGEIITAGQCLSYDSAVGSGFVDGDAIKFGVRLFVANLIGSPFLPGQTITGSISGATGIVILDDGGGGVYFYTTNDVIFQPGEVVSNGLGDSYDSSGQQTSTFGTATVIANSVTPTFLALENVVNPPGVFPTYFVGLTSGTTARTPDYYFGGQVAQVVEQNGTTLTIKNLNPITNFINGNQFIGGTSGSKALSRVTALLTSNDQHFVLQGGSEFAITTIFIANNSQPFTTVGSVYIYDAPNRGGNLIASINAAQLAAALNNNTNSYVKMNLSAFNNTKTVGVDMYLSIDTQEGSPLTANVRFIGYITE